MKILRLKNKLGGGMKVDGEVTLGGPGSKATGGQTSKPFEPPNYIHFRARRGQTTDSHSLAERTIILLF